MRPTHVWSYDCVAARTVDGAPLPILNIVDEFTREAVGCHVARSIGARDIVRVPGKVFTARDKPAILRSDNGREFIAATVIDWLADHDVTAAFIAKGRPQQNCYVERFNGTLRDELLNGELFHTLLEARVVITRWAQAYNHSHRHRSPGMMSPAAFAASMGKG